MKINIHLYHHFINKDIDEKLNQILKNQEIIMGANDEIQAKLSAIQESADNIAADIEKLMTTIAGGLTKDEAEAVNATLGSIADRMKAIADLNA